MRRIVVTGGSGFVGRHVVAALLHAPRAHLLRLLVHRTPVPPEVAVGVELVRGDLGDPTSLAACCEGADTVLHLASHIGDDEAACEAVNARGTKALMAAAREAGARNLLYLSNAAVYGYAVHNGAREDHVRVAPATPVSRSRARAEKAVLEAGGMVLRPLFVYGEGDERFIPVLMRAFMRLPFLPNGGRARLSVVAVDDLAAAIAALAASGWAPSESAAHHVTDGCPVTLREIAVILGRSLGVPVPKHSLPYGLARWIVRLGARSAAGGTRWTRSSAHRLFLVSYDHCYDAARLWSLLGSSPGPPLAKRFPAYAAWYARFVPDRPAALRTSPVGA